MRDHILYLLLTVGVGLLELPARVFRCLTGT